MTDFVGQELQVGDMVVKAHYYHGLDIGVIGQIFKRVCRVQLFFPTSSVEWDEHGSNHLGVYGNHYITVGDTEQSLIKLITVGPLKAQTATQVAALAYQRKVVSRANRKGRL